jgi:2-methylcitrate dehydratase
MTPSHASQRTRKISSIERIAEWSLGQDPSFSAPLSVRQSGLLLLDSIGCMLAAQRSKTAREVVQLVAELGGNPHCTIVGQPFKSSAPNAVLANGALVRALDLNDVMFIQKEGHLSVGGHCSDNIPVVMAIGEMVNASLRQVLEAFAMGYQLFGRLRDVMPFSSAWDGTSASGLVAAAMAGRLMGLDLERQAHALAYGATRCSTPKIVRWGDLSAMKNLANALIAEEAVRGTLMAARGLTGPLEVLDHKGGLHQVFDPRLDLATIWAPVSGLPNILLANVKTYPCIGTAQTEIKAAIDAHVKVKGRINEISKIIVTMADVPMIRNQQGEESRQYPTTREEADHSFTFLPAIVLADGELGEKQFANARWTHADMRNLAGKVEMTLSAELAARAPGSMPCHLQIIFNDGSEVVSECLYPPGHSFPDSGLNQDVVESKFRICAEGHLSHQASDRIISALVEDDLKAGFADVMTHVAQART